jgi:hypothetical protein
MVGELSGTQLLAAASQILSGSGYVGATMPGDNLASAYTSRVFEDRYGIVAVYVFDTWAQLVEEWPIAQGQLVDLISESLRRPEPKAWEGFLVLMTPGLMPVGERTIINSIRADTNRVRKLVAAGDELGTLKEIQGFLLPLVPLEIDESLSAEVGLLESLPELLQEQGVAARVTGIVLEAFARNESILQRLHDLGSTT